MTPCEGRFRLSWRHPFFKGDLNLELFLRGVVSGDRATPHGILAPMDRYDGGATARIASVTLFFVYLNLRDDVQEAAAYYGGWASLPYFSSRMGLTWRFLN